MPEFQYHASASDGKMCHGKLQAADKADLIAQLQQQALFLVSFTEVSEAIPAEAPPATPASVPEAVPETRPEDSVSTPITWKHGVLIILALLAGIGVGLWRWHMRPPTLDPSLLNSKLSQFQANMTRREIEQLFGPATALTPTGASRYLVPPSWIVDVQYDNRDGVGNMENRPVNQGVQISVDNHHSK